MTAAPEPSPAEQAVIDRFEAAKEPDEIRIIRVVVALLAVAEELDEERDGFGYQIRNYLKPGPGDRIRNTIVAALEPVR